MEIGGLERAEQRGLPDWSLYKIQLYEHNGNNVGFEFNQIYLSLPPLLMSYLSGGTLFHLSDSQSLHPNVYWAAIVSQAPCWSYIYMYFIYYIRGLTHSQALCKVLTSPSLLHHWFVSTCLANIYEAIYCAGNRDMINEEGKHFPWWGLYSIGNLRYEGVSMPST